MIKIIALGLAVLVASASGARALTLPDIGKIMFVGSTQELHHIRGAIAHAAGYPSWAWTFPAAYSWVPSSLLGAPLGLGEVDCLDSSYAPDQGPFDGSEDYLGMSSSVIIDDVEVGVEIPALEDLRAQPDWPGECYGYLFYEYCIATGWLAEFICPDPVI
jgi:hypothetical protein